MHGYLRSEFATHLWRRAARAAPLDHGAVEMKSMYAVLSGSRSGSGSLNSRREAGK